MPGEQEIRPGFEASKETYRFKASDLEAVADTVVKSSLRVNPSDRIVISTSINPEVRRLTGMVQDRIQRLGASVQIYEEDPRSVALELIPLKGQKRQEYLRRINQIIEPTRQLVVAGTKAARIVQRDLNWWKGVDPKILKDYQNAYKKEVWKVVLKKPWVLVDLPSESFAAESGMDLSEYADFYFRACNRDWDKIKDAQQVLIDEILNPGKTLEIFAGRQPSGEFHDPYLGNSYESYLWMDITDQTFANSTVTHNIPGSEVFSSPRRYSTRGKISFPGPLLFSQQQIPNLTLEIEGGKIIKAEVRSANKEDQRTSQEWVDKILKTPGANEIGEIGFGTNRAIDKLVLIPSLIEKIGGSIHIAPGDAYRNREFGAKVDNKVRSRVHEDLTCPLLEEYGGGIVAIDGVVIQVGGQFLDPRLAPLNEAA